MKKAFFLALLAGFLLPLGYPPLHWWWASLVAFIPFLWALGECRKKRETALISFCCGALAVGIAYAWLLSFIQWAGYWSVLFFLSVVVYQSFYFILFGLVFFSLSKRFGKGVASLAAPFIWALFEYLSSFGIFGIPELLGHAEFGNRLFRDAAPLLGVNGVSFLAVGFSSLLVVWILDRGCPRWTKATLTVLFLILVGSIHFLKKAQDHRLEASSGNPVRLAIIQPNFNPVWINDVGMQDEIYSRYLDATRSYVLKLTDLIIWPENVFPDLGDRSGRWRYQLFNMLGTSGDQILFGGPQESEQRHYNAAFLYEGQELKASYQKERLFPFGEYLPASLLLQPISWLLPAKLRGEHFSIGNDIEPLRSRSGRIGVSICLESLYGDIARRRVMDGADFLVNLTNDSWFIGSTAAEKHFFVGAMRAVENGRYFVQSALYGVSGIVDPSGHTMIRTGPEQSRTLEASIIPMSEKTWFTRMGLWPFGVLLLITGLNLIIFKLGCHHET